MASPRALERLRTIGPVFRSKEAIAAGVCWRDLYGLRDEGELLELSRGLFQLAEAAGAGNVDFVRSAPGHRTGWSSWTRRWRTGT